MNTLVRIFAGLAGGLAAAASKILALDVPQLAQFTSTGRLDEMDELRVTIFIFTPILMFLGAIIAWASQENNRMKLLALGAAAPALRVVRAVDLRHQSGLRILDHMRAGHVVRKTKPHLAPRAQPEEFPRRLFHEIGALYPQLP